MQQLVFIDDSGDPGFKQHSSRYFVMACAVFISAEVAEKVSAKMREFRKKERLHEKYEFKFHRTKKVVVERLLTTLAKYDFTVSAVYLDKEKDKDLLYLIDHPKLYNWAIKDLLQHLPLKEARIRIDGRSSKEYMRSASTYLRKELNTRTKKILNIRFEDSGRNDLIQLADIIAGSIHRSLQTDRADAKDCIKKIKKKVDSIREISTH